MRLLLPPPPPRQQCSLSAPLYSEVQQLTTAEPAYIVAPVQWMDDNKFSEFLVFIFAVNSHWMDEWMQMPTVLWPLARFHRQISIYCNAGAGTLVRQWKAHSPAQLTINCNWMQLNAKAQSQCHVYFWLLSDDYHKFYIDYRIRSARLPGMCRIECRARKL